MTLPQAAPEKGPSARGEHFSHASTAATERWNAWIAGPTMWFWCHQPKRTKPCLKIMTSGAVECPWCDPKKEVVKRGYVPLYRCSDTAPRCTIVNELYEEVTAKFKLHDRVTIGKEAEDADPVWIMRALSQQPAFQSTLQHRWRDVDLTNSLLKIWGSAELRLWYTKAMSASDNAVSQPQPGVKVSDWPRFVTLATHGQSTGSVAPAPEIGTGDPDSDAEQQFLRDVQAGRATSANGHHKKPRPKKG